MLPRSVLRMLMMNESIKRLSDIITTGIQRGTHTNARVHTLNKNAQLTQPIKRRCETPVINAYSPVVCNSEDCCSAAERVMAGRVYYFLLPPHPPRNCNVISGDLKTLRQIRFWHKGRNGGVAGSFVMTY